MICLYPQVIVISSWYYGIGHWWKQSLVKCQMTKNRNNVILNGVVNL